MKRQLKLFYIFKRSKWRFILHSCFYLQEMVSFDSCCPKDFIIVAIVNFINFKKKFELSLAFINPLFYDLLRRILLQNLKGAELALWNQKKVGSFLKPTVLSWPGSGLTTNQRKAYRDQMLVHWASPHQRMVCAHVEVLQQAARASVIILHELWGSYVSPETKAFLECFTCQWEWMIFGCFIPCVVIMETFPVKPWLDLASQFEAVILASVFCNSL